MAPKRPTRATEAKKAYLALQALGRREHRPTAELLQLYTLEGFLDRLTDSKHSAKLVLKGGVLLSAYELRRPTRDVDLHASIPANDAEAVLAIVREVAAVDRQDGLIFDSASAVATTIRDEDEYSGVRVTLRCALASAKLAFHVDVNVGDPIWPAPEKVALPRLLGGSIVLSGYPLPMVHAEKIVTAVQRGTANTRWRDFADVYLLAGRHPVDGDALERAIREVANFRRVDLAPLAEVLDGYGTLGQLRWAAWRRKQLLEDRLPGALGDIVAAVSAFADPPLIKLASGLQWNPTQREWS